MSKKRTEPLEYTGACDAEYWDEKGPHIATPGMDPVRFTPKMVKIRELEEVWKRPDKPTAAKTKKTKKSKKPNARKKAHGVPIVNSDEKKGGEE